MNHPLGQPLVTICVLTFGGYSGLARQTLDSIQRCCLRTEYKLVVGANAVCAETSRLLTARHEAGDIDRLIVSATNLSKCPMMRRMFAEIDTEYIWWFDDDSYITEPGALAQWIRAAPVRALDWPDHRLLRTGDDVFLGEAIRQQGWDQRDLGPLGVALDTEPRRGIQPSR